MSYVNAKIKLAYEETLKFFRQKGVLLQALSDSEEIFIQLEEKLKPKKLSGVLNREAIDMILAKATCENHNIQCSVTIDPFTMSEFSRYLKKKNYTSPESIFAGNMRALEGIRSLEDDIDQIEQNCKDFILLTEDEPEIPIQTENMVQLEDVLLIENLLETPNFEDFITGHFEEFEQMGDDSVGYQFNH